MSIKVEKGIPISDRRSGGGTIYPWAQMEEGDSFFVACNGDARQRANSIKLAGRAYFLRHGRKLACTARIVDGGVRVWAVKRDS